MATLEQILHAKAIELGKLAIRATTEAGSGHPTSALSLAHLTTVVMYRIMRWDPKHPDHPGSDRLVLSEGHAVPIIYAACADLGVTFRPAGGERPLTVDDLMQLRAIDSPLDGHPNPQLGFPFFDAATGSLGQGLSVAAGLGCAARVDRTERMVYCLIGDGESREGQIWEAMDFIVDHRLTNVVAIFNCNNLGQSDFVAPTQDWEHLARKAAAFDWRVETIDGHNPTEIEKTLRSAGDGRPLCVIARTVKGWGVPQLGGMGHHGTPVSKKELGAVLAELDKRAAELGAADIDPNEMAKALAIRPPGPAPSRPAPFGRPSSFSDAVAGESKLAEQVRTTKKLSPRRAFGLALKALGAANPAVVALDGDVKNSTYALDFAKAYPERFFEARIAEQNMVSAAAGLAAGGKTPFASTFGRFMERAFDQIEMAIISGANLKLVGTHVGITLASDGPSQMGLADIAFMRALAHVTDHRGNPAVTVLTPSDAVSAYQLVLAMAAFPSACYLRAVRGDLPLLYDPGEAFPFGGHKLVRQADGDGRKVMLAATGYMVHSCLAAAERLKGEGIAAAVVDAYALPMDAEPVFALAQQLGASILAVEDNYVGGLASEIAEAAAGRPDAPVVQAMTVRRIPKSGRTPDDVLSYVHLSLNEIVDAARTLLG